MIDLESRGTDIEVPDAPKFAAVTYRGRDIGNLRRQDGTIMAYYDDRSADRIGGGDTVEAALAWMRRQHRSTGNEVADPVALIDVPTVLYDLNEAVYHADQLCPERSLSSTMAKTILQEAGPARLKAVLDGGQERKAEFDFGSAAHSRVLGRGQTVTAIDGNRNSKTVQIAIAAAEARGELVLKSHEVAAIDAMEAAIRAHPLAADLLDGGRGKPEVSMFGLDPDTGRWLRGRLDFLHSRKLILDYKTAASVNTSSLTSSVWDYGYYTQAAHYRALAIALDLVDPDADYVLIGQEKKAPYLVHVHRLDAELLDYGARQIRTAIDLWDRCLTLDDWPGFPASITTIHAPKWADLQGDSND